MDAGGDSGGPANAHGESAPASVRRGAPPGEAGEEARQRWRIIFARDRGSLDRAHREIADEWIARLRRGSLPLAGSGGRRRPPLSFAAPLPVRTGAEREIADLHLADRRAAWTVRESIADALPAELVLVDLYDVWLGEPPLAAAVVAADYRVELGPEVGDVERLAAAARDLLAARVVERQRQRGDAAVRYDLRALVDDVRVERDEPPLVRIRTRFDPARGAGRPEEVLAALAERAGEPVAATGIVRERIVLRSG